MKSHKVSGGQPDAETIPDVQYVQVRGVSKVFSGSRRRKSVVALDDVSFGVHRGEFLSLLGPSGCGKSTLLKMISGLARPSSGSVVIDGETVQGPHPVGMVFQTPSLLPWKSALGNVMSSIELAGLPYRKHLSEARRLLELVGLSDFAGAYPRELSGGMQQRIALCRALVHDPHLLLMDEPFGALDAFTRDEMNAELLRIWNAGPQAKTVVFVTHSIPEAVFLSDRILIMSSRPGRVREIFQPDLPRPRDEGVRRTQLFAEAVRQVYDRVYEQTDGAPIHG